MGPPSCSPGRERKRRICLKDSFPRLLQPVLVRFSSFPFLTASSFQGKTPPFHGEGKPKGVPTELRRAKVLCNSASLSGFLVLSVVKSLMRQQAPAPQTYLSHKVDKRATLPDPQRCATVLRSVTQQCFTQRDYRPFSASL